MNTYIIKWKHIGIYSLIIMPSSATRTDLFWAIDVEHNPLEAEIRKIKLNNFVLSYDGYAPSIVESPEPDIVELWKMGNTCEKFDEDEVKKIYKETFIKHEPPNIIHSGECSES